MSKQKVGLNLGPGKKWNHPDFINLDHPGARAGIDVHVVHDLASNGPLPFERETFKYVYCSHVLEHLNYETVGHVVSECERILKPGGVLRITTPCFEKGLRAYQSGNRDFWVKDWTPVFADYSNEQAFLDVFAAPCSEFSVRFLGMRGYESLLIPDQRVKMLFTHGSLDECLAKAITISEPLAGFNAIEPRCHISPWTVERFQQLLPFEHSEAKQSRSPLLRGPMFDNTIPRASLFVEWIKG